MVEPQRITCSPAERLLLESRRAAAEELYRRADALVSQAVDAVLVSHAAARDGRVVAVEAQEGGALVLVLTTPEA